MKREYRLSGIIIAVLTMASSYIMCINEHISVQIIVMCLFTSAALLASFLGSKVSRKMIQTGDQIPELPKRVLYYIALFFALLAVTCILYLIYEAVTDILPYSNELGIAAGQAMLTVVISASFLIFVIIPYFQTLIVLLLRKLLAK